MLSSNNKIVSSRFFEQTNFEQLIMTRKISKFLKFRVFKVYNNNDDNNNNNNVYFKGPYLKSLSYTNVLFKLEMNAQQNETF